MNEEPKFSILFSEEVDKFLQSLPEKAKVKILYNINLVTYGRLDSTLFKKLSGTEIWEFRTLFGGIAYRLLAFFDTRNQALIITTHGFIKKSQKTPDNEILRANKIRDEYFNSK